MVPEAQEFFQNFLAELLFNSVTPLNQKRIQMALHSKFHPSSLTVSDSERAQAGLCLRCYVSHAILKACKKLDGSFGIKKSFTYQDLLRFVLDDDGKKLVILDRECKTKLILNEDGQTKESDYSLFTVEILRTYHPSESSMSLDNWAELKTRQNQDLKKFLSEFGLQHLSDWAILNRARHRQLECLSVRDRYLVKVFHAVYRRDRCQEGQRRKCPDPNEAQLQEMLALLQEREVVINTSDQLMGELKQVAKQLRQYDVWSNIEPLEKYDPETENYTIRTDLPQSSLELSDIEEQEFLEFLHEQLRLTLTEAMEQEIQNRLRELANSRRYSPLVERFIPGLQLYYTEGRSLRDIASRFGMTSHDQAQRLLNPGGLLRGVRTLMVQQLLDKTLNKVQSMQVTENPPPPNYLRTLAEQIEAFADEQVFQKATAEIRTGRKRSMNSLYAQQLLLYCQQYVDLDKE
ncbi:hypothetical protein [Calothrix rhizosoleniae]|uniref:hypothetical protein n=1 Tax=Calothrix rhizosoleniae TaxID=888997 RepID=UPI001F222602|nr:hypothetical protein [Calothrix rhizosoleniae]